MILNFAVVRKTFGHFSFEPTHLAILNLPGHEKWVLYFSCKPEVGMVWTALCPLQREGRLNLMHIRHAKRG